MNKIKTGITALIIGLIATTGTVFAFGLGLNSENREEIMNAIEANDYNAWKEAMVETLTEERFNKMVERHQHMIEVNQNREAMIQALEDGDYEAWKTSVENLAKPRITEIITEENFDIFVQLHKAKMTGDYETAKELSEELEIGMGACGHRMFGFRRMRGRMWGSVPLEGE